VEGETLGESQLGPAGRGVDDAHRVLEPLDSPGEAGGGLGFGELREHVRINLGSGLLGQGPAQDADRALGRAARQRVARRRPQRLHGARIGFSRRSQEVRRDLLVRGSGCRQDHRGATVGGSAVEG
jgi:hypothetical protein